MDTDGGGFFQPDAAIATPPASAAASSAPASSLSGSRLPPPRSKPLKTGGPKESAFIRYADERVRQIQRRYAKRGGGGGGGAGTANGDVKGYAGLKEAFRDIDQLVDVVWVSGTPSLQIAYLLTLADLVNEYMKGFPVSPAPLFRSLDKLDHAFASLLQGRDVESGEALPGFEGGRRVNATEKVRINSMVHYARSAVVEVMLKYDPEREERDESGDEDEETAQESGLEADVDVADDGDWTEDGVGTWEMKTAKVYDRTLVELGDDLTNAPPIGLRVEKPEEACRAQEAELDDSDRVMELDD